MDRRCRISSPRKLPTTTVDSRNSRSRACTVPARVHLSAAITVPRLLSRSNNTEQLYTSRALCTANYPGRVVCLRHLLCDRREEITNAHHGEVRSQEVYQKGKVQGQVESVASDAAAQGTERDRYEFQSAQDRFAGPAQGTR